MGINKTRLLSGGTIVTRLRFITLIFVFGSLTFILAGSYAKRVSGRTERANAAVLQTTSDSKLWQPVDEASLGSTAKRLVIPTSYKTLTLDKQSLGQLLAKAPLEFSSAAAAGKVVMTMPMPDGSYTSFSIVESPIFEAKLAASLPGIRNFRGQGIDDPTATMRFDWTSEGFHAMVLSAGETVFVDPYAERDTDHYITYFRKDNGGKGEPFRCFATEGEIKSAASEVPTPQPTLVSNGGILRTYRLAVAATGEYNNLFRQDGDLDPKARAFAAITTTVMRVTLLFERELSVRFILVDNEPSIIYTNPAVDRTQMKT